MLAMATGPTGHSPPPLSDAQSRFKSVSDSSCNDARYFDTVAQWYLLSRPRHRQPHFSHRRARLSTRWAIGGLCWADSAVNEGLVVDNGLLCAVGAVVDVGSA